MQGTARNQQSARDEFDQRQVRLGGYPSMLAVYTTDACNLACIGCDIGKKVASRLSISDKGYQHVIDAFPFVSTIGIAGAEMFFDAGNPKGYMRTLFAAAEKHPHLRFIGFTNATLLTPERIALIVEKFNWVGISIDSPYPEVYRTIRVGGQLERVVSNIKKISALKAEKGLGRGDRPRIILSSVIMELTYRTIRELVELAYESGAAQVNYLEPWEGTYEERNIFRDRARTMEYLEYRKEADARARELGIRVQDRTRNTIMYAMPDLKDRLELSGNEIMGKWPGCCDAPWTELYIWRNGDARICCTSSTILGNINDSSVRELWNSPAAVDVRKRILKGNYQRDCQKNCHRGYVLPHCQKKGLIRQVTGLFRKR